jgi:uncharacterized membrane protein YhaH (DUF805 family)
MSYDANAAYNSGAGDSGQGIPGAWVPGQEMPGNGMPGGQGYGGPGYGGSGYGGEPRGASSPDDFSLPLYGASFGQAVKRFFKNYAKFSGRASRSEYWWATLFVALVQLIPYALLIIGVIMIIVEASTDPYGFAGPSGGSIALTAIGGSLMGLFWLAIIVPTIAMSWRRLHDAGFAGPFYLLSLTYVGGIVVFVMTLMPPKPEGQRYDA